MTGVCVAGTPRVHSEPVAHLHDLYIPKKRQKRARVAGCLCQRHTCSLSAFVVVKVMYMGHGFAASWLSYSEGVTTPGAHCPNSFSGGTAAIGCPVSIGYRCRESASDRVGKERSNTDTNREKKKHLHCCTLCAYRWVVHRIDADYKREC